VPDGREAACVRVAPLPHVRGLSCAVRAVLRNAPSVVALEDGASNVGKRAPAEKELVRVAAAVGVDVPVAVWDARGGVDRGD
jgi:hypothetical protein